MPRSSSSTLRKRRRGRRRSSDALRGRTTCEGRAPPPQPSLLPQARGRPLKPTPPPSRCPQRQAVHRAPDVLGAHAEPHARAVPVSIRPPRTARCATKGERDMTSPWPVSGSIDESPLLYVCTASSRPVGQGVVVERRFPDERSSSTACPADRPRYSIPVVRAADSDLRCDRGIGRGVPAQSPTPSSEPTTCSCPPTRPDRLRLPPCAPSANCPSGSRAAHLTTSGGRIVEPSEEGDVLVLGRKTDAARGASSSARNESPAPAVHERSASAAAAGAFQASSMLEAGRGPCYLLNPRKRLATSDAFSLRKLDRVSAPSAAAELVHLRFVCTKRDLRFARTAHWLRWGGLVGGATVPSKSARSDRVLPCRGHRVATPPSSWTRRHRRRIQRRPPRVGRRRADRRSLP